ncbi:MAG: DUF2811 domain-containing protein [Crocosphaera sp.]|nr:DUF2811 domain-containing protein [Crocosphaera sp.]
MKPSIALEVEIPEETYVLLTNFIENHGTLGFNEVISLAVSSFLINQTIPINSSQSYLSNVYNYANHSKVLEQ